MSRMPLAQLRVLGERRDCRVDARGAPPPRATVGVERCDDAARDVLERGPPASCSTALLVVLGQPPVEPREPAGDRMRARRGRGCRRRSA